MGQSAPASADFIPQCIVREGANEHVETRRKDEDWERDNLGGSI